MQDERIPDLTASSALSSTDGLIFQQGENTTIGELGLLSSYLASEIKTLTNKRVTPRVYSSTYSLNIALNLDTYDVAIQTQMNGNTNIQNTTGTAIIGQKIIYAFFDNGTSRTITWDTQFKSSTEYSLPVATVINKLIIVELVYFLTNFYVTNVLIQS